MSVQTSLGAIAQTFAQHNNALRLRKLIFCACTQRWESDRTRLEQQPWPQLLQDLYYRYPNPEALGDAIFGVVKQLNRQGEYSRLAQIILDQLTPLYGENATETTQFLTEQTQFFNEETQFFAPTAPHLDPDDPDTTTIITIAANLNAMEQNLRMRKLLWCLRHNSWENDPQALLRIDLATLIGDLQQEYPTREDFKQALGQVVGNLSRRREYEAIAASILEIINPLYHAMFSPDPNLGDALPPVVMVMEQTPAATTIQSLETEVHLQTAISPPDLSEFPALDFLKSDNPTTTEYDLKTSTNFTPAQPPPALQSPAVKLPDYDRYGVRLAVMKYANPLRAKILAFSILNHNFTTDSHEWSSLRTQPFDDLLRLLHEEYSTWDHLVEKLTATAAQLEAPAESTQAAEAIAKAMKPYYIPSR
ncbi:MAG: hypothetical protein EA366_07025 [Spirulina sp. DLM2.Bin59]|nr:MAG: hypothetical protein EA366_07025 [Spirulina sp. DLM2.Bin59]